MKTKEVAKIFAVDERTIRNWADNGKLKCSKAGDQRTYDISDVRELYMSGMRGYLLKVMVTMQRINYYKKLPASDRELLAKESLFCDWYHLATKEVTYILPKIAGSKNGYFKKLIELYELDTTSRNRCEVLSEDIDRLLSSVRDFRNYDAHVLFGPNCLNYDVVNQLADKIHEFFGLIDSTYVMKEVFGAELAIRSLLVRCQDAKEFDQLMYKLKMSMSSTLKLTINATLDFTSGVVELVNAETGQLVASV